MSLDRMRPSALPEMAGKVSFLRRRGCRLSITTRVVGILTTILTYKLQENDKDSADFYNLKVDFTQIDVAGSNERVGLAQKGREVLLFL